MPNDKVIALTATSERPASTYSGYLMLMVLLLAIIAEIYGVRLLAKAPDGPDPTGLSIIAAATLVFVLVMPGFYMLQPNQAAAIMLFGE